MEWGGVSFLVVLFAWFNVFNKEYYEKLVHLVKSAGRTDVLISQLKESDSNDLFNTSMRLLQEPSKKEVKELAKPFDKSGIWRKLAGFLGEDKAKELYDSYQK